MIKETYRMWLIVLVFISPLFFLSSCYYDNEEELYKYVQSPCDTSLFAYAKDIEPIINKNCISCHGTGTTTGILLEGHSALTAYINKDKNRFLGSINHTGSYKKMPQNGNKMSDCNLTKIDKWINAGMPNN